jgi:heat shock protein HslJ
VDRRRLSPNDTKLVKARCSIDISTTIPTGYAMKPTLATLILLIALVMSGCRDWFPPVDPNPSSGRVDPTEVTGKRWRMDALYRAGIVESMLPRTGYIELDGAGTMTGFGGFNTFTANYTMANGSIRITNMVATKQWGDTTEAHFFDLLSRSIRYETDTFDLILYTGNADEKLSFSPLTADTVGISGAKKVQIGQDFKLLVGNYAQMMDGQPNVYFTFSGLIDDSRCPAGVVCAQEGDASVSISLIQGGFSFSGEIHTNASFGPKTTTLGGYDVTLVGLTPLPLAGVPLDPATYIAELRITRH